MKKIIFFIILTFTIFASSYKDGEYYVISNKFDFGWKPFLKITILNSKVKDIIFDRIDKKGELASKNYNYNESMKIMKGTNPLEYSLKIPKNYFYTNQNLDKMDEIAGATDSLREFKIMIVFLLDKASKGEIGKYEIEKSKLK